jgi:hypothetical protein
MKTNQEKNMEHDARQQDKVRPKSPQYDFEPLQEVMNSWLRNHE